MILAKSTLPVFLERLGRKGPQTPKLNPPPSQVTATKKEGLQPTGEMVVLGQSPKRLVQHVPGGYSFYEYHVPVLY